MIHELLMVPAYAGGTFAYGAGASYTFSRANRALFRRCPDAQHEVIPQIKKHHKSCWHVEGAFCLSLAWPATVLIFLFGRYIVRPALILGQAAANHPVYGAIGDDYLKSINAAKALDPGKMDEQFDLLKKELAELTVTEPTPKPSFRLDQPDVIDVG
jgi:hypothetical protein